MGIVNSGEFFLPAVARSGFGNGESLIRYLNSSSLATSWQVASVARFASRPRNDVGSIGPFLIVSINCMTSGERY